jgi:glycosyltransferase involved in cell wall biosynthesis
LQDRTFKFSVVVPIYKVEAYLAETIDSVIGQSVGFERNIQLILVNDGSPDDSERICLEYVRRFPENVVYVRQDNAGVSAARNTGMQYVRGEIVNFLDSDDIWDSRAFETASTFFADHPNTNVISVRLQFFDAAEGFHTLDYKFAEDRVIDISVDFDHPQLHVNSVFLRAEAIKDRAFDTRLKISEDFRFLTPIILSSGNYGVLGSTVYWYRRRQTQDSAINLATRSRTWYLDTPRFCFEELFDHAEEAYGSIPPYLQYAVMYDLQWRLKPEITDVINADEREEYKQCIVGLLRRIDDSVIFRNRRLFVEYKLFAFALKHARTMEDVRKSLVIGNKSAFIDGIRARNLRKQKLIVEITEVRGDDLILEGFIDTVFAKSDIELVFRTNVGEFPVELVARPELDVYSLGQKINEHIGFRVRVPLAGTRLIRPVVNYRGSLRLTPLLAFGKLARLNRLLPATYFIDGRYRFHLNGNSIKVRQDVPRFRIIGREVKVLWQLAVHRRRYAAAAFRVAHFAHRFFVGSRRIWLLSDRIMSAGDNGEAFFRYLSHEPPRDIRPYFILSRDSGDFGRMKRIGRVVPHGSLRHKLLFLAAEAVVSSAGEDHVINAFGGDRQYLRDLYSFQFVFLQHGITKDDLSLWLNKYNKNIKLFVTAARPEYQSILECNYHLSEDNVKLTGFPRHDALRDCRSVPEKKIVFMPTWRKELTSDQNPDTGLRKPFPGFADSEYFRLNNALINDPRILAAMADSGFTGHFFVHPTMVQELDKFSGNALVSVESQCDYQHQFQTAALLITDYSSVAFDFAMLSKPVVYAQFDSETFYEGHTYDKGYFDYERDGFGPVCLDYESPVSAIVEALGRDCKPDPAFLMRADSFFFVPETSSCDLVLREILRITR